MKGKGMEHLEQRKVIFSFLGQTRSGLLPMHLALPSFLGCCKCMFQVFQVFHMHVASVSCGCCKSRSGCCICFAMAIHVCCKRLFQMFQLFHMHVASVSCGCCKSRSGCCILQWLYTYVASFCSKHFISFYRRMSQVCLSGYCICFTHMLQVFHSDVSYVFTHTLQVFHLDVAYILQWLHTCFPGVFDICCKCFNCFIRML